MTKNKAIYFAKNSVIRSHSVGTQMSNNWYENYISIPVNPVFHKYANIGARVHKSSFIIDFESQTNVCTSVIHCFGARALEYQVDRGSAQ